MVINANDLKVKGISAFSQILEEFQTAFIAVRGKQKYVLMTKEEHDRLYEQEILLAQKQVHEDIKNGDSHTSVLDHLEFVRP